MNAIVEATAFSRESAPVPFEPSTAEPPLVLAVDDNPNNLLLLGELLDPDYGTRFAKSGRQALAAARMDPKPELILLDLMMPGMDGFEVLQHLRADPATADIPVIFVTAKDAFEDEEKGLKLGAVDYVAKPINPPVLLARMATHLELKRARDHLASQNARLEEQVSHRTREIQVVKRASIRALASLGETRDNETGLHILRTQLYIEALGQRLMHHPRFADALTPARLALIVEAAPLHDIGKIGIRDAILLKPGKLTPEEFTIMKTHASLGGEALGRALLEATSTGAPDAAAGKDSPDSPLEFLRVAREIALCHHEKWDGSGYPAGLAGDDIPVSARLMALADVFDALISRRVYKAAMPLDEVRRIIVEGRGRHFDPEIVDTFVEGIEAFEGIARRYADPETPAGEKP